MGRTSPLGGPTEQPCLWQPERECRLWRSSFPLVAVRVRLPTCRSYGGRPSAEDDAPPVFLHPTTIFLIFWGASLRALPAPPCFTQAGLEPPSSPGVCGCWPRLLSGVAPPT